MSEPTGTSTLTASSRAIAALCLCGVALAGVVHTRAGRLDGRVGFGADRVEVDGKAVGWGDVLIAVREARGTTLSARDVVRLKTGEAWVCDVRALVAKKLTVRFPLFGEQHVDVAQVAAIDFVRGLPAAGDERVSTLYREKGEPVPGKILWLDARHVAIDSPIGVLEIPRRNANRYVVANGTTLPQDGDEVGLTDGTVLHGALSPGKQGLQLEHALLGTLAIPSNAVRSVLRRADGVAYLAEQAPKATVLPLVRQAPEPGTVAYPDADGSAWLKGVRVAPRTTLRYRLPDAKGRSFVFRAGLAPIEGSVGDLRLRVLAGGKALLEQELEAGADWPPVSAEVPGAGELTLEIDFGTRIRFPCGVVLCDPHVVVR